jgi:hypothetical protein
MGSPEPPELREFMYLDEVSVTSLLASQVVGIPETITSTQGSSLEAELKGTASANAGVAKSQIESRLTSARQQESQIVSKAVVQTLFKQLHEKQAENLLLSVTTDRDVPAEDLIRGRLVELDVTLRTEPVFELTAAMSTILDMSKDSPELTSNLAGVGTAWEIRQLLDHLLAGLVPIRGRVHGYVVAVAADGSEHVVRAAQADGRNLTRFKPLELVGVTEQRLYWKDLRRVIFSDAKVRMLCRIGRDGLHDSWTAVKHLDMFRRLSTDIADQLEAAMRFDASALVTAEQRADRHRSDVTEALRMYAQALLETNGVGDEQEAAGLAAEFADEAVPDESYDRRRQRFAALTAEIEARHGFETPVGLAADLRSAVMVETGIIGPPRPASETPQAEGTGGRLLDVEIVAIYW